MSVVEMVVDRGALLWNSVQLSTSVQRLRAAYSALSDRDQVALKILSVVLLCALIYVVLMPAHQYASGAKQRAAQQEYTLNWMQENRSQFGSKSSNSARAEGQSLLSVSSNAGKQWGLAFKRFEPVDDTAMRVWFEDVNFASVIRWIAELDSTYNIAVRELQMDQSAAGAINASLVLQE